MAAHTARMCPGQSSSSGGTLPAACVAVGPEGLCLLPSVVSHDSPHPAADLTCGVFRAQNPCRDVFRVGKAFAPCCSLAPEPLPCRVSSSAALCACCQSWC